MKLLTPMASNTKTAKGDLTKYHGAILHGAPASLSGYNACTSSTEGCRAACLNTAGRGGMIKKGETTNVIQQARIRKTRLLFENQVEFMAQLIDDIGLLVQQADRLGRIPVVRLNGTTDIKWEDIKIDGFLNVFEYWPNVQFYDYTAHPFRMRLTEYYPNLHLTFSRKESNGRVASLVAKQGHNVAVVFSEIPSEYLGVPVIDGDSNGDFRFLDPNGVIVGLKAKGKAKRDTSGFVVQVNECVLSHEYEKVS